MLVYKKMRPLGIVLWALGTVRLHKDGDGFRVVFRAVHPLTWLTMALLLVPCALLGEKLLDVVPLGLSRFWQDNEDQLQWVTPFTELDSLKPFQVRALA